MRLPFKRRKEALFAGLALILGTIAGVGLLEMGARWLGLSDPIQLHSGLISDPFVPWKPRPGSTISGVSPGGEFSYRHAHNSQGFRDVEHSWRRPEGVLRIVGIGDSFTYGVGVALEKTYLARLEAMLNGRGQGEVEIVKLGVSRYWPEAERLMLEHYGLRYEPQLVLVGVLPNDVFDTRTGPGAIKVSKGFLVTRQAERLGAGVQWLYTHSYAARAILSRLLRGRQVKTVENLEDVWQQIHAEHRKMVQLARRAGAATVFVHIPQKPPWGHGATDMPRRLRQFCDDEDCLFIDVLPEMRQHPEPDSLYYPQDGHCTEAGYEIVARVIHQGLIAHALVPASGEVPSSLK